MSNKLIVALALSFWLFAVNASGQTAKTRFEDYLEKAKTIVVARCISVGSVNILLRADVEIEILHVVKGKETLRTIHVESQFGMVPGSFYLLRTENEVVAGKPYFRIDSRHSVIPIVSASEVEQLKSLSPRIIVLRTMNIRVDELESQIRTLEYELEELKRARKDN